MSQAKQRPLVDIAAGVMAFGPIPNNDAPVTVHYVNLPGKYIAATDPPTRIGIDKRPKSYWRGSVTGGKQNQRRLSAH